MSGSKNTKKTKKTNNKKLSGSQWSQASKKSSAPVMIVLGALLVVLVVTVAVLAAAGVGEQKPSPLNPAQTAGEKSPASAPPSASAKSVPPGPDMHSLLVDPKDPSHLFYGNHDGLYESFDAGAGWKAVPTLVKQDAMAMDLDGDTLWVAGHDVLFKGAMKGGFALPRTDLPGMDIHGFAASASQPGTMYAFVVGHGLQKTTDGGKEWVAVSGATTNMGIHGLVVDRTDADVIFAIEMNSGLLRSTDGGKSWGGTSLQGMAMSVATGPGGVVLAATQEGVQRSTDGGATWTKSDSGPALLVALSSGKKATAYMVDPDGGVHRSDDSGVSWK